MADTPSCGRCAHRCPEKHSGGIFTGPPKTEAGKRLLPVPAQLMETLKTHPAAPDLSRRQVGTAWKGFMSANVERVDPVSYLGNGHAIDSRKEKTGSIGSCS